MGSENRWQVWLVSALISAAVLALVSGNGHRLTAEDARQSGTVDRTENVQDQSPDGDEPATSDERPEQAELREELKKLNAAIGKDSADFSARQRRAEVHLELGESDAALADADQLIVMQPDEGSYRRLRGKIHGTLENYEQAIADFGEALHLDPEDADSYRERGLAYWESGNSKAAALDLNSAALRRPDDEIARWHLAAVLSQLGKYEDAIREADYLIEKSPDNAANLRLRGHIQQEWGFFDKALADLSRAIRLDPGDAKAHGAIARVFRAQGRNQEAVVALDKAIELDSTVADAYRERATAYSAMANWPAALADLDETLHLDPTWVHAQVQRAAVLALSGDRERARSEYSAAMTAVAPRALVPWQDSLFEACSQAVEQSGNGERFEPDNILAEFTVADSKSIVVPVRIGAKALRMVLDTGAGVTGFDQSYRDLLGPETGKAGLSTPHGSTRVSLHGPITLSLETIDTISTRGPTVCCDLSIMQGGEGLPVGGVLGMDVLSQFVFRFDISRHKAYLLKSCPADAGVEIPLVEPAGSQMRMGNGLAVYPPPEILLTLPDGNAIPFLVDTGWEPGSIALESTNYGHVVDRKGIIPLGESLGGCVDSLQMSQFGVLKTIQLGVFRHKNLLVNETPAANVLGLNYLSRFVVTFDFPGRRLLLKPSPLFAVSEAERTLRLGNEWIDRVHAASATELAQTLDELIRADPGDAARYRHRARYYAMHDEYDKAIADLDVIIRLNPRDATNFFGRGNVYSYKHDADRAIADFDQAIALEPTMASAWRNRGLVWATKREFDHALRDLDEALRLAPDYSAAAEDRRMVLAAMRKRSAAVASEKSVAPRRCCSRGWRHRRCARMWRWRMCVFCVWR
jgi:tetratricopeptide (TPR) repeat protein